MVSRQDEAQDAVADLKRRSPDPDCSHMWDSNNHDHVIGVLDARITEYDHKNKRIKAAECEVAWCPHEGEWPQSTASTQNAADFLQGPFADIVKMCATLKLAPSY